MGNYLQKAIIEVTQQAADAIAPGAVSLQYLDVSGEPRFGDYSTNVALLLAKVKRCPLPKLAAELMDLITKAVAKSDFLKPRIARIELKGAGFINFFLTGEGYSGILKQIDLEKSDFGRLSLGRGKKVQIEFVSANPTGPLSVAHGRQAAVGDILGNILFFAGYRVMREYYVNDEGNQINKLGESLWARYQELFGKEAAIPEEGYRGGYMVDLAKEVREKYADKFVAANMDEHLPFFSAYAAQAILKIIRDDLAEFGVQYDVWFSQAALSKSRAIAESLALLEKNGFIYKQDNALWLRSTAFGDDKDRVLIKSDGSYTYITPDIAYHRRKFLEGYDLMINIWGPDHHGYIARLKAAAQALGFDREKLRILIIQLATLYRAGKVVPMSTRAGEYVTLEEVRKEVGRDAARFYFVMRKCDSHLDFDLELAKRKSLDNPVYYIQYAYARICSIFKFKEKAVVEINTPDLLLLDKPEEQHLIKIMGEFPRVIADCVHYLEPHALTVYLQALAAAFHSYYNKYRIIIDDAALTNSRLYLVTCLRQVLFNGLALLNVRAPEEM